MANSPETLPEKCFDFRAPPPSPIATGRRSSVANDEVLSDFLEHSLRVPDLILPDKIFPKQQFIEPPPRIDFELLNSSGNDSLKAEMLESVAGIGCFQLVNHGIPRDPIRAVLMAAAGIFHVSTENRMAMSRSPEKPYGFEELHGEDEGYVNEEFVWCRDDGLKLEMEGIWPLGYSNFSEKMESLATSTENVAGKILQVLSVNFLRNFACGNGRVQGQTLCYLYKHCQNTTGDRWVNSLRYDVIRMLIRGFDHSHALCFHLCDGSTEFHVYSKKGWVYFCPNDDNALIVTVGDHIQAWSGGLYKHVIGRPIFKGEYHHDCISMAFLYSPPSMLPYNIHSSNNEKGKTISLAQQAILALLFTLFYQFLVFIYKKF